MYIDKKIIYIILAIVAGYSMIGLLSNTNALLSLLYSIPGVLIAITFHEFAHAFAADKLGDDTPRLQGRLSLNPLAHLDPIGSLMLLFARVGWGKPVQINPTNFNRTISMSKGEAIVSAAGPIMNFILAFVFMIIYYTLFAATNALAGLSIMWQNVINYIILYTISINIGLGVFNLIPLPPLDGSKVLMHFLPAKGKEWFYNNQQIFYVVFLLIWITGLSSVILQPAFTAVYAGIRWVVEKLFRLLSLI